MSSLAFSCPRRQPDLDVFTVDDGPAVARLDLLASSLYASSHRIRAVGDTEPAIGCLVDAFPVVREFLHCVRVVFGCWGRMDCHWTACIGRRKFGRRACRCGLGAGTLQGTQCVRSCKRARVGRLGARRVAIARCEVPCRLLAPRLGILGLCDLLVWARLLVACRGRGF